MTANQPLNDAIVIGIDFGTTFSGVAWAYSREPDEIEIVTSWDAELNHCSDVEKAPTQLYFDDNSQDIKWGYSVPVDKEPLKWFKLLLIGPKDLPTDVARSSQLQEARRLRNKIKKEPIEIIATFLRKLWDHSLDSITRAIGADILKRTKLQVVITLPAIWPPYAQQRMKQAAQQSGILDGRPAGATTLRFISEPEAAALATIKDLAKRSNIQTGDTIVVCDAGGGTVDLISYIFESTDPFVIKECVKGDGDLCGGVFLDEGFIKLVRKKSPSGTWGAVSKSDEKKFLNDQWENGIKPQFENQKRTWPVDLPESCGRNPSQRLRRRITIDLTSWTAICRGAVVQGLLQHNPGSSLGINVETRIARMSYGIICSVPFIEGWHDKRDKEWDDSEQRFEASNQMRWFLREGEDISKKRSVRHDFYRLFPGSTIDVEETIYYSTTFPPPSRHDSSSSNVRPLCDIKWNKGISVEKLSKYINPVGQIFSQLYHAIEMDCEDGIVNFTVHHDGSKVGEQNVEIQFS
ncbi:hypothetical protein ACHAQI_006381 [Fusarium lateritium]